MGYFAPDGIDLEEYYLEHITGSYISGNWYDTNLDRPDMVDGMYVIHIYASCFNAGAGLYYSHACSTPFMWSNYGPNNTTNSTITGPNGWMGHSPGGFATLDAFMNFRIKHNSGGVNQLIQIKFNQAMTSLSTADGRKVELRVNKIG